LVILINHQSIFIFHPFSPDIMGAMRVLSALLGTILGAAPVLVASPEKTQLDITVYPNGQGLEPVLKYRLTCSPSGGTVPQPDRACSALVALPHPFASVPTGTMCATFVLGPQEAIITGSYLGVTVNAHLVLRNSCEVGRWRALRAVVPGFPGK
jgi:hypothetical protein